MSLTFFLIFFISGYAYIFMKWEDTVRNIADQQKIIDAQGKKIEELQKEILNIKISLKNK